MILLKGSAASNGIIKFKTTSKQKGPVCLICFTDFCLIIRDKLHRFFRTKNHLGYGILRSEGENFCK